MIRFVLNGEDVQTDDTPDTPLLWVVRDTFALKGAKFGCGAGLCGACTMHVDGQVARTCALPLAAVAGKRVTTIEGLGTTEAPHPAAKCLGRAGGSPMRLLSIRADHVRRRPFGA